MNSVPALLAAVCAIVAAAAPAGAQSFSSNAAITIPRGRPAATRGPADPYPSEIVVSGVAGPVVSVTVTLGNITHTHPTDLDVLLESPSGRTIMLMSDCGGGADVNGLTLTFRDDALLKLPDSVALTPGSFRASDFGINGDQLPPPAPQRPFTGSSLSTLARDAVNGVWRLWIADDSDGDVGSIGTWSISFARATTGGQP
jgi:subtilisin-like proprotein convertase family protein